MRETKPGSDTYSVSVITDSVTESKPDVQLVIDLLSEFEQQLRSDRQLLKRFEKFIDSDGREFIEHGQRWLFDSDGRRIGIEEFWKLDVKQLGKFFKLECEYRNGWRWRVRNFFEQLFG